MYPTHTTDQLAVARTMAAERQRRADVHRTTQTIRTERADRPRLPYWATLNPRLAAVNVAVAAVASFALFSSLTPATAEVAEDAAAVEYDSYTGSHERLQPGLPDGHWQPHTTTPTDYPADRAR